MDIKEIAKAAYDWAEQDDNKRTVLFISSEKKNETEEGYGLAVSQTTNGQMGQMTEALVDAMKEDKGLAKVVCNAFLAYAIEHSGPVGIGVISINGKEEGDNE